MVFFTCNHCGEAVKKPAVDKHYNTKCRNNRISVSCMDCLKDFQNNYVEHIKCITEMQKYSGKDYVPRESENSGAKKQESWTGVVHAILDSSEYNLSEKTRRAFEMLQNYDNVPRKKAKFLNFVTNSVHIPRQTVEDVWNILEKEQEKIKQARQVELGAGKKQKEPAKTEKYNNNEDFHENGIKEVQNNDQIEEEKPKKKKKNKDKKVQLKLETEEIAEANVVEVDKKKKKKNKETEIQNIVENGEKPKKIKKNAKESNEVSNKVLDNDDGSKKKDESLTLEPEMEETLSKKKKRKAGAEETSSPEDFLEKKPKILENGSFNFESENKPSKKTNGIVESSKTSENNGEIYTFCWDTELVRIVGKHPEGITLEKLKKKVLKKFKTKFSDELTEHQQKGFNKKFNKKLSRNVAVKQEGELVKACS